jgi:DMSO/TMAO reductase YedYZ molybdopterin-dependent catalytic subunit
MVELTSIARDEHRFLLLAERTIPMVTVIVSPDTRRTQRIPPGQRQTNRFPVLHYGRVYQVAPEQWTFSIRGLVEQEITINYQQFTSLPRAQLLADIHCVTSWSKLDTHWAGVSTSTLRDLAVIRPEARFVIVYAMGGFTTNLTSDDFFAEDVLLADEYEGQPISAEHGGPVRLVVPRLYFWKSAKWVTGIEFTAEDRPGFWEIHGYHNRGDPWKEERYG